MKAIRVHQFGGPEVLQYEDVPELSPGPGEALVGLRAIGVNYTDIQTRSGRNPSPLPWIPGREGAGVVEAVGQGVTQVAVGDRVAFSSVPGSYAQKIAIPADRLVKVPDGVSDKQAASIMLQGMTAHYLTQSTYKLKKGDTCLIHAGAGGMGLLLIQMAKNIGATVITTVSTSAKAELARSVGADVVINYTQQDFQEETMKATGGQGVQVVYDAVGRTTFDQGIACLAPLGMMALYGAASGPVPPVDTSILSGKSLFLTRPGLPAYTARREDLLWRANDVLGWVASGQIKLHINSELPLPEAAEAHRRLEGRETTGKVLLVP